MHDKELYSAVLDAMARHDMLGLNYDRDDTTEYRYEAERVLPRLHEASSSEGVLYLLYDVFVRSVGEGQAGDKVRYARLAQEIWDLWQRRASAEPGP